MTKIFFLLFVWGPAMVGFSLGWVIRHPHDWTGPAVVGPLGAVLSLVTYRWGLRRLPTLSEQLRPYFISAMIAGGLLGLVICGMLLLGVIG
jgi:hypothetical protein